MAFDHEHLVATQDAFAPKQQKTEDNRTDDEVLPPSIKSDDEKRMIVGVLDQSLECSAEMILGGGCGIRRDIVPVVHSVAVFSPDVVARTRATAEEGAGVPVRIVAGSITGTPASHLSTSPSRLLSMGAGTSPCAQDGAMHKYRCPDCGITFPKWTHCREHLQCTGHADAKQSLGLQQRCMQALQEKAAASAKICTPTLPSMVTWLLPKGAAGGDGRGDEKRMGGGAVVVKEGKSQNQGKKLKQTNQEFKPQALQALRAQAVGNACVRKGEGNIPGAAGGARPAGPEYADAEHARRLHIELNGPHAPQHDMSTMPNPNTNAHAHTSQFHSSSRSSAPEVSQESYDLSAQEFPDLDQGTERMLNHAKKYVALRGAGPSDPPSDISNVSWLLAFGDKKKFDPFLNPCERQLIDVPDEFADVFQYCSVIANNMLVEFWHEFQQGARAGIFCGEVQGTKGLYIKGCNADNGMVHNLVCISGSLYIVTAQEIAGKDKLWLTVQPKLIAQGSVRVESFGYVGSYVTELVALVELASRKKNESPSNVLKSVLCPRLDFPGKFEQRELSPIVPINESQSQTVNGLKHALEKIQGPPGTGKSTTIFHIINSRVPVGVKVLVTCSRNVAVESLAIKLEKLTHGGLVVFGNESRVGETAKRHLLEPKLQRQPAYVAVERIDKFSTEMQSAGSELIDGLRARQTLAIPCKSPLWRRAWCAYMRQKCLYPRLLGDWALRVALYGRTQVRKVADECQSEILGSSNIILCTIASTSRLLREWQEVCGKKPRIHTVIVDECGCTTESSTALLLRLNPTNLIMVGDHKQLPPTSTIRDEELAGTGHDRSLLARCCATASMHMLNEQYRMHEKICALVSYQFYDNLLLTSPTIVDDRRRKEKHPLIWVPVRGKEEFSPGAKRSYVNHDEIAAVLQVVTRLREEHPCASISVLTFYQGQLQELMRATPASLNVEVLTVDSCQGSEFDYVVLSTVRANSQRNIGFVQNKQRINVAISRSLYGLIVVGDDCTMSTDSDWEAVKKACKFRTADKWKLSLPLPAAGTFESVLDKLKREQKERKDQAMARYEFEAIKLMEEQPSFHNQKRRRKLNREDDDDADDAHNAPGLPSFSESRGDGDGGVDAVPASARSLADDISEDGWISNDEEKERIAVMRDHELARMIQLQDDEVDLEVLLKRVLCDMQPKDNLKIQQQMVAKWVDSILKDLYGPAAKCTPYGSSVCGLACKNADLDLTFTPACAGLHGYDKVEELRHIAKELRKRAKLRPGNPPWKVEQILARIPIVRINENAGQVDLSVENDLPVFKSKLLHEYTKFDKRYPDLVRLVKTWASSRDINSAQYGTFNSFGLSLLVLHYLQNLEIPILPRLHLRDDEWDACDQDWKVPPPPLPPGIQDTCEGVEIRHYTQHELRGWVTQNKMSMTMLTHGFFKYFARTFPWDTHLVSVTSPGLVPKSSTNLRSGQNSYIFIQDPLEMDDNCARAIRRDTKKTVLAEFERAYSLDFHEFLCSISTHAHPRTHSHMQPKAQMQTHTPSQTLSQTQTQTQTPTQTQTQAITTVHAPTHTYTHTHTAAAALQPTPACTHTSTHPHTHTHTLVPPITPTSSPQNTHTHTHTHTLSTPNEEASPWEHRFSSFEASQMDLAQAISTCNYPGEVLQLLDFFAVRFAQGLSAGNLVAAIQRIIITTPHDMARQEILQNFKFQNLVMQIEHLLQHHTFLEQDLATLVHSAAKFQLLRMPLFCLVQKQVVGSPGQLAQFSARQLVAITWAYLEVNFPAQPLFEAVNFRASRTPELANMLSQSGLLVRIAGFSLLGPRHDHQPLESGISMGTRHDDQSLEFTGIQHPQHPQHPQQSQQSRQPQEQQSHTAPCSSAAVGDAVCAVTVATVPTTTAVHLQHLDENQRTLVDMGFSDQRENLLVLAKYGNDVNRTLDELMRRRIVREQQQQQQQQHQMVAEMAPKIHSQDTGKAAGNMEAASKVVAKMEAATSVAASSKAPTPKTLSSKANGSSVIPFDQTLVIKQVPKDKKREIDDALGTKTSHMVHHFSNPSFVDDRYGPGLVCFANYKSSRACVEAVDAMQDWFAKRDWAKDVKVHVKK